jgi:type IV pilus assembly protein PilE
VHSFAVFPFQNIGLAMKKSSVLSLNSCPKIQNGFTLVEVMIVVAIVAILSSVALPLYTDYIRRGQVTEAATFLSDYRIKMEQYYQDYKNYGTAACVDGANPPAWANFATAGAKFFTFTCSLPASSSYLITATGASGRALGHVYTINQNNVQTTTSFKGTAVTVNCWRFKGDEC